MNVRENAINELLSSFRFARHEATPESHPSYPLIIKDSGICPSLRSSKTGMNVRGNVINELLSSFRFARHEAIPESHPSYPLITKDSGIRPTLCSVQNRNDGAGKEGHSGF